MSLSTGLRFRVFVDGEMVDEAWIGRPGDERPPETVATWQGTICRDAELAGKRWRLEVYEPDSDETLWFGSDSAGMVMPPTLWLASVANPN